MREKEETRYTMKEISEATGIKSTTLQGRRRMPDLEKVIVELTAEIEDASHCRHCRLAVTMENALSLLKEQEQEISRLKHHVDCDAAEKIPSGCVGYGRGFNDDEPCETCKACEKYNGYGEE